MPDSSDEEVERPKVERARKPGWFFGSETAIHAVFLVIGAVSIALIFRKLQYSTSAICCGDFDGYYHIKWSRLLWEGMRAGHFPPTFRWLPLTTLNPSDYVDHHLFFHFLQIPFTWFNDLRAGAKMAALLYASLAVFSCYLLIFRYRIRHTLIWLVALLACSAPFLYRLNMAKAPPVAIILTVVGIYLLFEKKYLLLLPLAFIFVWTYSLFVMLVVASIIWTIAIGWSEKRFEWQPFVWTIIGTSAGFLINPYFPKNIRLFIEHVLIKATATGFTTEVGQEWYPYDSWYLLGSCAIAFLAMIVGYAAYESADRRRSARPLFLLIFSTLLMIASFRSRRWVEYWPPFAILFAAFSLKPILEGARSVIGRLPTELMEELRPFLDLHDPPGIIESERRRDFWKEIEIAAIGIALGLATYFIVKQAVYPRELSLTIVAIVVFVTLLGFAAYVFWRRSLIQTFAVLLVALLVVVINFNVRETRKSIEGDAPPDRYEASLAWVRENVPEGERIFNTDWDDFPKMFYYDTRHAYASGLDPTYLLNRDNQLKREPNLAELYKKITLGQDVMLNNEKQEYGPLIREKFGARYVFSDNEEIHENFYAKAVASGWFDQVHIYTFERKDGRPLSEQDLATLKEAAPPELNNWTLISGGHRVVSGAVRDFTCGDINGLCVDFFVNKDIDSTVLRVRDQRGEPPEEAQTEMGEEEEEGADEPVNEVPENQ
jgi:hypothetical protein